METTVSLKITSTELSSEQIAAMLGIAPDGSWNIGDLSPHTQLNEKSSGIIIELGTTHDLIIDEHIETITAKLKPFRPKLLGLSENHEAELTVVIHVVEATDMSDNSGYCSPGVGFASPFIKFLASIHVGLDFNGCVLFSENNEPS